MRDALRRGALCVNHPYRAGPFYLLLPLNTQPARLTVNLGGAAGAAAAAEAGARRRQGARCGGGDDRQARQESRSRPAAARAAMTRRCGGWRKPRARRSCCRPARPACCPMRHAQNMHVGGSKGSISGNYAMAEAELLIVIGSRAVCQADCSGDRLQEGAGGDQYQRRFRRQHCTTTTRSRSSATSARWPSGWRKNWKNRTCAKNKSDWLKACAEQEEANGRDYQGASAMRARRLRDEVWQKPVLTQPAAIKIVADFAK